MTPPPPPEESVTVAAALATMSQQIVGLTQTVDHLREDLRYQSETYARQDVMDARLTGLDREVRDLKTRADKGDERLDEAVAKLDNRAEARRVPWTAVGAVVIAAIGLVITLTQTIAGG